MIIAPSDAAGVPGAGTVISNILNALMGPGGTNEMLVTDSDNQTWLTGATGSQPEGFGWYWVSETAAECGVNIDLCPQKARALAAADGFNSANYDVIIYVLAGDVRLRWSASGRGTPGQIWGDMVPATVTYDPTMYFHELGHVFGIGHANGLECHNAPLDAPPPPPSSCFSVTYGDPYDGLGAFDVTRAPGFSSARKARLSWLGPGAVLTVDGTSGVYQIYRLEENGGVRAIRIPRTYENGEVKTWLWLEFRTYPSPGYYWKDGVQLRVMIDEPGAPLPFIHTKLVDSTPFSSWNTSEDFYDAPMSLGASITDPLSGVTVEVITFGPTIAVVELTFP